jgi:hypothetical protein
LCRVEEAQYRDSECVYWPLGETSNSLQSGLCKGGGGREKR